jgi:hypothetical protein
MGSRQIVLVSTAGFSVLNTGIFWREAKTKRLFSQCVCTCTCIPRWKEGGKPIMPRLDLLCYRLPLAEQINRPVYFSASSQLEITHNIVQGTGWGIQAQRQELAHRGRRNPIHSSSSPKHNIFVLYGLLDTFLHNVLSLTHRKNNI